MDRAFGILFSLQRGTSHHGKWVVECLNGSWAKIVGEKLAAVCRPVYLRDSVLKVEVIDDAWMDAVRSMRLELQHKLYNDTCGEVKEIRIISVEKDLL
jgi:predicted nucleic acid-binding Zn ribbon protein